MSGPPPLLFQWTGDSFTPAGPHVARQCDKHFVVGALYPLEVREERSSASHRHYHAAIAEAHKNLREEAAERLATPDHLRKFALIKTGYRDERSIPCASKAEALRLRAFIAPMDEFAVVTTSGNVVTVWTAKSQSFRAMDKATFQRSKDDVLTYIASLIGATARDLASSEAA